MNSLMKIVEIYVEEINELEKMQKGFCSVINSIRYLEGTCCDINALYHDKALNEEEYSKIIDYINEKLPTKYSKGFHVKEVFTQPE